MGRGGKKYKLTFHKALKSPHDASQEELVHKSTQYTSHHGHLRASSSYVSSAAQPVETTHQVPDIGDDLVDNLDDEGHDPAYLVHLEETSIETEPIPRKRTAGDDPFKLWLPERDRFLAELITLEGKGYHVSNLCPTCPQIVEIPYKLPNEAEYECLDCCSGRQMLCQDCLLLTHHAHPLHRVRVSAIVTMAKISIDKLVGEKWNGQFFEKIMLRDLGLRIQLGHSLGTHCPNPNRSPGDDFVIIDLQGVHQVGLDFCGCGQSNQLHTTQLLRHRLYPATTVNPKTAFTFHLLEHFELLSYASKVSCFEYYQTLTRLTDNTGTQPVKDRYPALLRVVRQWRYLMMLKRSARGHDPNGAVAGIKEGECAVLCPACPQEDFNMPEDWNPDDDAAIEREPGKNALFIAIDANFRLKRKHVSSEEKDPDLGKGFAFYVNNAPYVEHCNKYKDTIEPKSNCSRHDAVNLSNAKPGTSHAASGVGTIECARHNMKRPNAVGDLQFHERYYNMDYLFWRSLLGSKLRELYISYDICCQWSINLKERMFELDKQFLIFDEQVYVRFVVPKFHLPAHVARCRTMFSLNYTIGAGRTDGEAPERGWAEINPLATSTKEMGPGSRRDALDAHFGDYNWRKITGLGTAMFRKARAAAADMAEHTIAHDQLTSTLPAETVRGWREEVEAWEKDSTQRNPYEMTVELPTQAATRRKMAESEAADLAAGRDVALDVDVTPSVLISSGIDLEAEQRAHKSEQDKIWEHSQDRQKTKIQLRSNTLSRKLTVWSQRQQLYMPNVTILRRLDSAAAADDAAKSKKPKPVSEYPLWLPSRIQTRVPFDIRLAEIEWNLRVPQAAESLDSLRRNLQMRAYLWKFKDKNVRGQHANTRARNAIETVQARIDASADEYRAAQTAIISLGDLLQKTGPWKDEYPELRNDDIREVGETEEGVSAGRSITSWIWRTISLGSADDDVLLRDTLRVEWCKSRARSMRFAEEVDLLNEEMARILRFFVTQEKSWIGKAEYWSASEIGETPHGQGLSAYARRQAMIRAKMATAFRTTWLPIPKLISEARMKIAASRILLREHSSAVGAEDRSPSGVGR